MTRTLLPFLFAALFFLPSTRCEAQFGPAQTLLSQGPPPHLDAVDVNGDGLQDLVGLFDQEVRWAENLGGGVLQDFATMATVSAPGVYTLVDLDQNGIMDVAFVVGHEVFVAMGQEGGLWNTGLSAELTSTTGAITHGDVTGNGTADLIVTSQIGGDWGITVIPNNNGILQSPVPVPGQLQGAPPAILLAGELDEATGMDILAITADGMAAGFMNTTGNGAEWQQITLFHLFDYQFERPVLMDVDGDGDLDVAEANAMVVQWVENRIDEELPFNLFTVRVLEPFLTAGIGSFGHPGCGDGASVVFIPSNPDLPVYWRTFLPGTLRFSPRKELAGIPRGDRILLADMNGDGRDDLLIGDASGVQMFPSQLQPPTLEVLLPALDTVCVNGPSIQLPEASPAGGTWTGTWVSDNMFHRSSVGGTATVPLSYTLHEPQGCPVGATAFIRVVAGPVIQPFLGPVVCTGDGPFLMTSQPQATEWSGLSEGNILDLDTYAGEQIVAVYTDPTGSTCLSFMGPLNIWGSVPVAIQAAGPFCVNDGLQTISPVQEWAVNNWGGDIAGVTGQVAIFDPAQGPGTYTIWLQRSPTGPQQCANSDTITIVVSDDIPEISLTQPPAYCATTGPLALDFAQPEGGIWTGPGVSGNVIDPALAGPGEHLVTYTLLNPGGCSNSGGIMLSLVSTVDIQHPGAASNNFCIDQDPLQLQVHPEGGEWSAPVSSNGIFDPAAAGLGQHEIFHVYTDPNGCVIVNPPLTFTVLEEPVEVTIDPLDLICLEQPPFEITGNVSGIWSGAVEGKGPAAWFDPMVLGPGIWTVILTAEAEGFCPGVASMDVLVEICSGMESRIAATMLLSPNPTNGITWLHLPGVEPVTLDLWDPAGRLVRSWISTESGPIALDVSFLASGAYHLQARQAGDVMHLKLIRE